MERIPDDLGTAVNVQTMVFGNKGDDSGTGVAFTRNPSTGENLAYGDFLTNAQGEDVVAGIRITEPLDAMGNEFPECHQQLIDVMALLEGHYHDMCDIEFTIEQGRLFILQTRVGKRTAAAALRMAVEMEGEGLIDQREAVLRVQPEQLDQLLHPQFDPHATYQVLATGLNASPGAAVGKVYFTADDAEAAAAEGEHVILVRPETSPEDLHGMIAAEGILTSRGGLVSHAAVVARGMGTPAICGADALDIDLARQEFRVTADREVGGVVSSITTTVHRGEVISINGSTGEVVVGEVPVVTPEPGGPFGIVLGWADGYRTMKVRTNADLPEDAVKAREFGAEGIGLCRTEHMFLGDRLPLVQKMILAETEDEETARARGAPRPAAHRLRRDPRGDGRPAGHGAAARPAAPRVPAAARRDPRPPGRRVHQRHQRPRGRQAHARAAPLGRGEPDARHPRVPSRHPEAGPLPDAGAGAARGRGRPQAGRR